LFSLLLPRLFSHIQTGSLVPKKRLGSILAATDTAFGTNENPSFRNQPDHFSLCCNLVVERESQERLVEHCGAKPITVDCPPQIAPRHALSRVCVASEPRTHQYGALSHRVLLIRTARYISASVSFSGS
jgi:hypothetical protein